MFDIVISNGNIINPELNAMSIHNIGIKNGKIVTITSDELQGINTINASGLIVSPGFIDVHGHIDGHSYCAELSLRQGVTTTVGGNCGLSPIDINSFFEEQDKKGFLINQAELIGHSFSMREAVGITDVYCAATENQIVQMEYLTEKGLSDGACGLSFGLDYAPKSSFAEVIALSKIAAKHKKPVTIHTRMFSDDDIDSLFEAIEISRSTGSSLLISHFVYQYNHIMDKALLLVDNAINEGLNIRIDSGMYTSWSTYAGTATFSEEFIKNGTFDLNKMIVATGKYKGSRLNMDLYRKIRANHPDESIIYENNDDESIYLALKKSYAMPSSDSAEYAKGEGHPQIAGSFPKYFKDMVRDNNVLTLIDAVRKTTLLPAETMGFKNKGRIKEGMDADIVIFDINTISDNANFPHAGLPDAHPDGIKYVIVNGILTLSEDKLINDKAGKTIRI